VRRAERLVDELELACGEEDPNEIARGDRPGQWREARELPLTIRPLLARRGDPHPLAEEGWTERALDKLVRNARVLLE